jgi:hypothetical protein
MIPRMAKRAKALSTPQPNPVLEAADQLHAANDVEAPKQNPTGIVVHLAQATYGERSGGFLCGSAWQPSGTKPSPQGKQVIAGHGSPDMCPECLAKRLEANWGPYPKTIVGVI